MEGVLFIYTLNVFIFKLAFFILLDIFAIYQIYFIIILYVYHKKCKIS